MADEWYLAVGGKNDATVIMTGESVTEIDKIAFPMLKWYIDNGFYFGYHENTKGYKALDKITWEE